MPSSMLRQGDFECSICDKAILFTPIINSHNNVNGIYCLDCVNNHQVFYSFYRNTYLEELIRDHCSDEGLLPWTIRCFFCDDTILYSSCIDHFKNDCQDLNWIQDGKGTDLLSSSIIDDGDITVKLNGVDNACIILPNTIVMLKRKGGDEWNVAVVGSDPVQVKYSEDITETLIKYVLLDIQPSQSFKEFDVSSVFIFKGVLRIVEVEDKQDTASICSTQFFLDLVDDIKERDKSNVKN